LVALRHLPRSLTLSESRSGPGSSRSARSTTSWRSARKCDAEASRDSRPTSSASTAISLICTTPAPAACRAFPSTTSTSGFVDAAIVQQEAFRRGVGRDIGLHLDTNFNYKIEGYLRLARALEAGGLVWLDVAWNGILKSVKIAAIADAYEVNIAPYNFNGHLGSLISAHTCAAVPNFKVTEIDIDDMSWKYDIVARPPVIDNGDLVLPNGPGWGADANEDFVRAHPPRG
jgi:L-alanine-DL-glutamate epimerase-like enolase superfamily enzyme